MSTPVKNPYIVPRIIVLSMAVANVSYLVIGLALTTDMTFSIEKMTPVTEMPAAATTILLPVFLVAALSTITAAKFLSAKLLAKMKPEDELPILMKKWTSSVILQHALVETAGILGLVGMLLTGSPWTAALNFIAIGVHVAWFPNVTSDENLKKLARDLKP